MGRHVLSTAVVIILLCLLPTDSPTPGATSDEAMSNYVEFNLIVLKPGVDETTFVSEFRNWLADCHHLEQCKSIELLTPMNLSFSHLGIDRMEPLPRHYGWIKVWDSQDTFYEMQQNESEEYKAHVDLLHNRIYGQSVIVTLHYANSYSVSE